MSLMTKREFVMTLVRDHGLMRDDALKMTELIFGHVKKYILEGREVRIGEVGSFRFKFLKPRKNHKSNIDGTVTDVPTRVKLKLRVFPKMRKEINKRIQPQDDVTGDVP